MGVGVAAMTYDSVSALAEFGEERDIAYALLADEDSAFIDALGVRNKQYADERHPAYGVALPGILYVDATGVVRLKRAHEDYRSRPPFDEVLAAVAAVAE